MVYQYIVIGFFLFARGIGILPATNNLPTLKGVLFFMLAGLFFTSYNIGIKKWSVPAIQAVLLSVFYSAIIFLPIYFFFESNLLRTDRAEVFFQMFYQGIIVFIAVVLFSYSSLQLGNSKASFIGLLLKSRKKDIHLFID